MVAKGAGLPARPRLADELESMTPGLMLEDDLLVVGQCIGGDFSGQEGAGIVVEECRIEGARFTGSRLRRLRLSDVVVVGADFSGADMEESSFTRVELRECRMSGVLLPLALLRDVTFSECRIDGANLRRIDAERVRFDGVDLHDAELTAARFGSTSFFDCDLTQAEISQVVLGGARFNGSSLSGLRGAEYFKDAVIDSMQVSAVTLAVLAASGVRIDDDRDEPPPT
jgi:uncharacterized protein YjbI with pentapeptide repeats